MGRVKPGGLVRSVEEVVAEREALAVKERRLVESLNAVLRKMGYHVVPVSANLVRRRGRPPGSGTKRGPGRPRKTSARRAGRGRR